ncbi:DUF1648 domain-containing protein [Microbacterium bovistercoris]|uniref:DUF1648 domain-containing protein n=1 Tax=Microbacterium bovistercoris TaxID=2293570 RepID=A0A371NXS9_9MICO|nr:DUF1648 domain-containing protein [Microbacterium bovistercoris]REJ08199.1 DUF1648 domain-containing protein [Microbacterium bovistercoris]
MTEHPLDRQVSAVPEGDLRRARRALVLVGIVAPVVITAIAVGLILAWLPELPDPAATHWGVDGVDGFGAPVIYIWLAVGIGLGLPLLLVVSTLAMARGQWGVAARLLGAMALGLSGFSAVITTGSVAIQRGLEDATQVGGIGGILILGVVVLLALGAAGWFLQPHVHPTPAAALKPVHLASISTGERVVWMATATMSRGAMIIIGCAVVLLVAVTAVMVVQAPESAWVPALTLLIIGLAFAATASFRVKAGPDGLSVRSQIGVPRAVVPLDEVVSVRAVECHPFGEFGGFGWRLGVDGRTGIVLRTGPAIEVERRGRGRLIVTVDGAEVGAAVLQAYLDRAGAPSSRDATVEGGDA